MNSRDRNPSPRTFPLIERLEGRRLFASIPIFSTTSLVSDGSVPAAHIDPQFINPWGVSFDPGGEFWVSDNGSGVSTLYDGNGVKDTLVVTIPGIGGKPGMPTGQVANSGSGFNVTENGVSLPSVFIFATEDGTISGWNPNVDATNAIMMVNNSATAVYKGLTMATVNNAPELLAANFGAGTIDAFDSNFSPIQQAAGTFTDRHIPRHYAPFNVQNIDGNIFVTYAKQDAAKHDDLGGGGHGYVDEFTPDGTLVRRFQHGAFDNSPWGVAIAPTTFDKYSGDLLVGNFRSGFIDVYNPATGKFLGYVKSSRQKKVHLDHLWALTIGSGGPTESSSSLYFTAGVNNEAGGLFGTIQFSGTVKTGGNTGGGGGGIPGY